MIIMKFGGSSVESSEAIRRVCRIVKSRRSEHPVVVVSAVGHTTDQLLEMAAKATKGDGYSARRILSDVKDVHHRIADQLLGGNRHDMVTRSLQFAFRDLHEIVHDLAEEGRLLTPALSDEIASFGERLSSEIVAAALAETGLPTVHLDSREFIVTDDRHGAAKPDLWSTYARLRRTIPYLAESNVIVMGGFIAATDEGVGTTLGRGGSDLTASLVGAGISAREIQIWTDVDGMLSCDPRVAPCGYLLKSISYGEAAAMAAAGAKVLHPDSIQPAIRQRIPIVIRNSRHPDRPGTEVIAAAPTCSNIVKSIAVEQHFRSQEDALITLVGSGMSDAIAKRAIQTLRGDPATVVPQAEPSLAISILVPQKDVRKSVLLLHHEFFRHLDADAFAPVEREEQVAEPELTDLFDVAVRKTWFLSTYGLRGA